MIEVLDLFSAAAGGWSLGLHRAGFKTVAACEVEAWRRAIYSENNPNAKVYDDVRTLTADRLLHDLGRLPAVVVGSPPCQDISSANTKGRGVSGARSGLFFEAIRIIGEVRPRWFALENSANLRTRGYDAVKAAVEAIGYTCWPFVVRAGDLGANHERARSWVLGCDLEQVADPDSGAFGAIPRLCRGTDAFASRGAPLDASSLRHEGGGTWRHGPYGIGEAPAHGCDAADAACSGYAGRCSLRSGWQARDQHARDYASGGAGSVGEEASHAPGKRQSRQLGSDEGRRASEREYARCAARREMDLRAPDRGDACGGAALWTLADLADHLRLDDGLSARLASTRVALGAGKGQSAASLIVEAFGDAVIPQIPEAIGRAILRTEAALTIALGRDAA